MLTVRLSYMAFTFYNVAVGSFYANIFEVFLIIAAAAAKSLQLCLTPCDPIDGSHQVPPSLRLSRQEHQSGLPFPSPVHESEK